MWYVFERRYDFATDPYTSACVVLLIKMRGLRAKLEANGVWACGRPSAAVYLRSGRSKTKSAEMGWWVDHGASAAGQRPW